MLRRVEDRAALEEIVSFNQPPHPQCTQLLMKWWNDVIQKEIKSTSQQSQTEEHTRKTLFAEEEVTIMADDSTQLLLPGSRPWSAMGGCVSTNRCTTPGFQMTAIGTLLYRYIDSLPH